jgi:hypothetical protein
VDHERVDRPFILFESDRPHPIKTTGPIANLTGPAGRLRPFGSWQRQLKGLYYTRLQFANKPH